MNLMFWKKKTGAEEEAEKARESLDFASAKQDIAETDPESFEPESDGMDTDSPAKRGLGVRVKLQFIALARRFRKTPAPDADEDHAGQTEESPDPETLASPGLLMRISAGFTAFVREFKAPATGAAGGDEEDTESQGRSEASREDELPDAEMAAEPVHSRKWLVIGGSTVIVILLLGSIGSAYWPIVEPPQKRWGTRHEQMDISSTPRRPESEYEGSQAPASVRSPAEVEALKKENAELQARIEALKKVSPQHQPYAPTARQAGGEDAPSSVSGEMTIDNKDPKAAAMSLKEAINAMNAGSGERDKKPAK
mgnify:CR=1 FL=1|jgi:hypothetical protein